MGTYRDSEDLECASSDISLMFHALLCLFCLFCCAFLTPGARLQLNTRRFPSRMFLELFRGHMLRRSFRESWFCVLATADTAIHKPIGRCGATWKIGPSGSPTEGWTRTASRYG